MCMFPDGMTSKRVNVGSPGVDTTVPSDTQCRACSAVGDAEPVNDLQRALLSHQCIVGSGDCRYPMMQLCWIFRYPTRKST